MLRAFVGYVCLNAARVRIQLIELLTGGPRVPEKIIPDEAGSHPRYH
ncbi:MAG: hypothetical protein QG636_250 [Patescibacteria group bacterium]|nr:hypothetical protein [Patescibacteria group bacterium]